MAAKKNEDVESGTRRTDLIFTILSSQIFETIRCLRSTDNTIKNYDRYDYFIHDPVYSYRP